jgi:glucarate dehydratase
MKIVDLKTTPVTVPMEAPLRWSLGVERGTTRTILEVITDEGIVGIGETYGGSSTAGALQSLREMVAGTDPFEFEKTLKRLQVFCISYETFIAPHVTAALDMACLDIVGKALNRPVCSLLGGKHRDRVPFSAYLFFRYPSPDGKGGEDSPERLVDQALMLVERYGFEALKFKGGVLPPKQELRTLKLLREAFPDLLIRFDPNAAWSVSTSINTLRRMMEYDLEYAEDPTWGIEGMGLVRRDVPVPLATNMCVINFDQIPLGVRTRCIDIILSDVHYWGGLAANKRLAGVCETFQIGLGMHSDRELGISTAAQVHLAAALPYMSYACDSHYHHQADDIITRPFEYRDGCFEVPAGPGLGVELDREKLAKYARLHEEQGEAGEFLDPYRPEWVPKLPLW